MDFASVCAFNSAQMLVAHVHAVIISHAYIVHLRTCARMRCRHHWYALADMHTQCAHVHACATHICTDTCTHTCTHNAYRCTLVLHILAPIPTRVHAHTMRTGACMCYSHLHRYLHTCAHNAHRCMHEFISCGDLFVYPQSLCWSFALYTSWQLLSRFPFRSHGVASDCRPCLL